MHIASHSSNQSALKKIFKKMLPWFVFLLLTVTSIIIWLKSVEKDKKIVFEHTQSVSEQIAYRLQDAITARLNMLEVMATRWVIVPDWGYERFSNYASLLYSAFPGFQAINWIDTEGTITWVYPEEPNEAARNKNLYNHPEPGVRTTFRKVETEKCFGITPVIELFQSGQGFAVYFPLIPPDGSIQGYLNGVFRIKSLVEACITEGINERFYLSIMENDRSIYRSIEAIPRNANEESKQPFEIYYVNEAEMNIFGRTWIVQVCPSLYLERANVYKKNVVILIFGLILATGMSVGIYMLIKRGDEHRAAKEALYASEYQYRTTIDSMSDPIYVVGKDLKIILTNNALIKLNEELGIETDIIDQTIFEVYPFLPEVIRDEYQTVFDTGRVLITEEENVISGRKIITETRKIPFLEKDEVVRVVTVMRDITERKRAEEELRESEKRFRTLIEKSVESIFLINFEGEFVFWNRAVENMMGLTDIPAKKITIADVLTPDSLKTAMAKIARVVATGTTTPRSFELIAKKFDGTLAVMEIFIGLIEYEGETLMLGTARDITERKQADRQIRMLAHTMSSINEAVSITDIEGKLLYVNDAFCQMYQCERKEIMDGSIDDIRVEGQLPSITDITAQTINGGWNGELINRRCNGEEFPIYLSTSVVKNDEGEIIGLVGVAMDITERKQAEKTQNVLHEIANALNTTEDLDELLHTIHILLGAVVDTTNFFIALYDSETDSISLPYMVDERDEIAVFPAGKTLTSYIIKNRKPLLVDRAEIEEKIEAGEIETIGTLCKVWLGVPLKTGKEVIGAVVVQSYTDENLYTDRDLRILEFVSGQVAIAIERKQREAKLRESELRFQQIAENAQEWIWEVDAEGLYTYSSSMVEEILGYDPSEIVGKKHFYELFCLEERESLKKEAFGVFRRRESFQGFLNRNMHKDGRIIWLSTSGTPIFDDKGNFVGYRGADFDITKRKQAEEELKASDDFNRGIVSTAPVGILYLDRNGVVIYENPAMRQIAGLPISEQSNLIGQKFQDIPTLEVANGDKIVNKLLSGESVRGIELNYQIHSGEIRILELHGAPRIGPGGKPIGAVIMCLDLTDYKMVEAQLRQAQKMEAIGTLAGGIAHDFNNLLTGIMGSVELSLMNLESEHPLRKNLERIQLSAERAAELTAQLLAFGRQRYEEPKSLNINVCIDEAVELIRRIVGTQVEIKIEREPNIWMTRADAGQINQVLVNLLVNAADAILESGFIAIKSENVSVSPEYCKKHQDAQPGDYIQISIQDTGYGIPSEVIERIFEPFYTTKATGKGTGLGLSMAYGIVKGHEGWMEVQSIIGKGTTFKVFLPRVDELPAETVEKEPEIAQGGDETILLVDDEEIVRNLGTSILQQFGYNILTAIDGADAVEIYQKMGAEIDLVILDLTMPKKSGRETFLDLKKANPEVKIVISSGFSRIGSVDDLMKMGAKGFVQKPYRIGQLLSTVREALD
ncbi:MAG: PAS domain S-box protein [candidate division Zixibacteria bacterium]|nr:PAS domain S-box protein [Candidatus Tariuqbacter arcticus]